MQGLQFIKYIILIVLTSSKIYAAPLLPSPILEMDQLFNHHIIVVEKSTHRLYIYSNSDNIPVISADYKVATGKKAGNKLTRGDHRTPEGIYSITKFIPKNKLIKKYGKKNGQIYGAGAFVLNYPNPIDNLSNKTGSGIWIHSTNDETRIEKGLDSRGCIVVSNEDLKKISNYIELNKTSVIITQNLNFLRENTWLQDKTQIKDTISGWLNAWRSEKINKYVQYYDPQSFRDSKKRNYRRFKKYKKKVFAQKGRPQINISMVSILRAKNYAVVTFKQDYTSRSVNDTGKKVIYLKQDQYYNWKIINESWQKITETKTAYQANFTPSMRFFNENPPMRGNN